MFSEKEFLTVIIVCLLLSNALFFALPRLQKTLQELWNRFKNLAPAAKVLTACVLILFTIKGSTKVTNSASSSQQAPFLISELPSIGLIPSSMEGMNAVPDTGNAQFS